MKTLAEQGYMSMHTIETFISKIYPDDARDSHSMTLGTFNHYLQEKCEDFQKFKDPNAILEMVRIVGTYVATASVEYGHRSLIETKRLGKTANTPALNYWLLCEPAPRVGTHLWISLVMYEKRQSDTVKKMFQLIPLTTYSRHPPTSITDSIKKSIARNTYLDKSWQQTTIFCSVYIGRPLQSFSVRNPLAFSSRLRPFILQTPVSYTCKSTLIPNQMLLREVFLRLC
jgi:hypothetical protein